MSDEWALVVVAGYQLVFGLYLGWLLWGRASHRGGDQ